MNRGTITGLAVVVAVLVAAFLILEMSGGQSASESGDLLLPDFATQANDVIQVTVERSGTDAPLRVEKVDGNWQVPSRDAYAASLATIREVLRAMAEAKIVEPKTANPELHERLGLRDPSVDGSKGIKVTAAGDGFSTAVIFGNTAQGSYRYARLADAAQTFLVDRNPTLPEDTGDWLLQSLVDIDAAGVRSVRIEHPDGETIAISKENADDSNYVVADIPDGRELSYSTVGNGIAGALNDLQLTDVRRTPDELAGDSVLATFETFDGRQYVVRSYTDDDETWIDIDVSATADDMEVDALRERLRGWQFTVADFKANLLRRRFEDILKPLPDAE